MLFVEYLNHLNHLNHLSHSATLRWCFQDIASDEFYTLENMRMEVGEMEAFLIDVLAGGWAGLQDVMCGL